MALYLLSSCTPLSSLRSGPAEVRCPALFKGARSPTVLGPCANSTGECGIRRRLPGSSRGGVSGHFVLRMGGPLGRSARRGTAPFPGPPQPVGSIIPTRGRRSSCSLKDKWASSSYTHMEFSLQSATATRRKVLVPRPYSIHRGSEIALGLRFFRMPLRLPLRLPSHRLHQRRNVMYCRGLSHETLPLQRFLPILREVFILAVGTLTLFAAVKW